jgi:uncharacterized protein
MPRVIEPLLELHKIDLEIGDIKRLIERLPIQLAENQEELAVLEEKRAKLAGEGRSRLASADSSNVEIGVLEAKIEKYQSQLNIAKTQKEYDTLKSETSASREQISELETEALTAYDQAEELQAGASELDPEIKDAQGRLDKASSELEDRLADLNHSAEVLTRQRAEHIKIVEKDALKTYEQVFSKNPRGAMARVEGGLCTRCNMKLPPQTINLVLIGNNAMQCLSCGLICYSEDMPSN